MWGTRGERGGGEREKDGKRGVKGVQRKRCGRESKMGKDMLGSHIEWVQPKEVRWEAMQ